ncbi:MAG TPA: hypothetical protein VK211_09565 [Kamptonema sp.]|nr:hypothetical protein [Kamptonema sp.]
MPPITLNKPNSTAPPSQSRRKRGATALAEFPPLLETPPKYWFGDILRHKESGEKGQVVGLQWLGTGVPECWDGWYYTIQLLNIDFNNPHFRLRHVGGDWAEECGHEADYEPVRRAGANKA